MIRCKSENIEWLEFELFQPFPELVHGVFLRQGGVSDDPFSSLNFGGGTGDDLEKIATNRKKVLDLFQLTTMYSSKQVHHTDVACLPGEIDQLDKGCDGLITDHTDIALLIKHADCQAVIFYDPKKQVIANVHCGWRGNVHNIYEKTVQKLALRYGSSPSDLHVGISPSLGPDHSQFINYKTELPSHFERYQCSESHFDLWQISMDQLLKAGVLKAHIELAGLCTFCGEKDFFSYRRDKKTGRHGTVVALKGQLPVSRKEKSK